MSMCPANRLSNLVIMASPPQRNRRSILNPILSRVSPLATGNARVPMRGTHPSLRFGKPGLPQTFQVDAQDFRRKVRRRCFEPGDRQPGLKFERPAHPITRLLGTVEICTAGRLHAHRGAMARLFAQRSVYPLYGLLVAGRREMG